MGIGHWAFTQNPDGPSMGILGRGRCARESFKRLQGCSCVESGGPTRKCRVSAAHTGGCCFLLRGYPTSPVYRSMVHYTDYSHTVQSATSARSTGVIYVLYAVLYVAFLYGTKVQARTQLGGTVCKNSPVGIQGRSKTALSWLPCPSGHTRWGRGNGFMGMGKHATAKQQDACDSSSRVHPSSQSGPSRHARVSPSGGTNVRGQPRPSGWCTWNELSAS